MYLEFRLNRLLERCFLWHPAFIPCALPEWNAENEVEYFQDSFISFDDDEKPFYEAGYTCHFLSIKMAEKYDLTYRVGAYLDRHLVFPLLEFLSSKEVSAFSLIFYVLQE